LELSLSYEAAKQVIMRLVILLMKVTKKNPSSLIFWLLWRMMISKKEKKIKGNKAIDTDIWRRSGTSLNLKRKITPG
jgi:hypothetical protein